MTARTFCRAAVLAFTLPLLVGRSPLHAASADSAATSLAVALGPASALWLEGTSTVHDFECRSTEVEMALTGDPGGRQPSDAAGLAGLIRSAGVRGVAVVVPVRSLHSGKDGLDRNLLRSMRAEQHPDVRFQLVRYTLASDSAAGDTVRIRAEGLLTIAGRERPVTLDARVHGDEEGVCLEGNYALLMSDYGIKPPTMMLGTLRVGDRITVGYRLYLIPRDRNTGPSPQPK